MALNFTPRVDEGNRLFSTNGSCEFKEIMETCPSPTVPGLTVREGQQKKN